MNEKSKKLEMNEKKYFDYINAKRLRQLADMHELWLSTSGAEGAQLVLKNVMAWGNAFKNRDLRNSIMRDCALYFCFNGTNLEGANFTGSSFHGVKLKNTNLYGAILRNTKITSSSFLDANLHCADIKGAEFQYVSMMRPSLNLTLKAYKNGIFEMEIPYSHTHFFVIHKNKMMVQNGKFWGDLNEYEAAFKHKKWFSAPRMAYLRAIEEEAKRSEEHG